MTDDDQYEEAHQQLNILEQLQENITSAPTFLYVKACLLRQQPSQKTAAIQLLFQAYKLQMENSRATTFGVDYFIRFNPDFLLSVAEEYFHHNPESKCHFLLLDSFKVNVSYHQ